MSTSPRDDWRQPLVPLCLKAQRDPSPCDCGFGAWVYRPWRAKRPCRAKDCFDCRYGQREGHEQIVGVEEMCPRCGDVERFDHHGRLRETDRNPMFEGSRNHALDA